MDKKENAAIAKEAVDPRERQQLMKDFKFCRNLSMHAFEDDIKQILAKIDRVIVFLIENHLIDLHIEQWHLKGLNDPKSIKKRAEDLKKLLQTLYSEELDVEDEPQDQGRIIRRSIPRREGLILDLMKQFGERQKYEGILEDCKKYLRTQIAPTFNSVIPILDNIIARPRDRKALSGRIKTLQDAMNTLFNRIIALLNQISRVDSIIDQLETSEYEIEDHLKRECVVRHLLLQTLQKDRVLRTGSFALHFFTSKKEASTFLGGQVRTVRSEFASFDEAERKKILLPFFTQLVTSDIKKDRELVERYVPEWQSFEKMDVGRLEKVYARSLFFNLGNCFIFYEDHNGDILPVTDTDYFNHTIMQFLIFQTFKEESFDRMIGSIVEPYFLKHTQWMKFLSWNAGRKQSWKIVQTFLELQKKQGEISNEDQRQVYNMMKFGFLELEKAQKAIAEQVKEGSKKRVKYLPLIKRPYLVHQFMMYILKIAIFSEARATHNKAKETILTGRDFGFEGANTASVHGLNNFLKYRQMWNQVMPKLIQERQELFDPVEGFKIWFTMTLHDGGTYDRQNAIPWVSQDKYNNNNKKAHNMIGTYLVRENDLIKKLFRIEENKESDEKDDLNRLATMVTHHDTDGVWLDATNLLNAIENSDNLWADVARMRDTKSWKVQEKAKWNIIKSKIMDTLCGLADNSAGIAVFDEDDVCWVDPWEEKGSALFAIKGNRKLLFRILKTLINKDQKYYTKDPAGIQEWAEIKAKIRANVASSGNEVLRDKLIEAIDSGQFTARTAVSTAGVLNSGVLRYNGYDGTTLKITLCMDREVNEVLSKVFGRERVKPKAAGTFLSEKERQEHKDRLFTEFIFDRIEKFVEPYQKNGIVEGDIKEGEFRFYNCDLGGKKLPTVGVELKILELPGILNMVLTEDNSRRLLEAVDPSYFGKTPEYGPRSFAKKVA